VRVGGQVGGDGERFEILPDEDGAREDVESSVGIAGGGVAEEPACAGTNIRVYIIRTGRNGFGGERRVGVDRGIEEGGGGD
tara:strand:- start:313 stop:555 length:243 start_codon:yes stop_codon:yes gene_type:complete